MQWLCNQCGSHRVDADFMHLSMLDSKPKCRCRDCGRLMEPPRNRLLLVALLLVATLATVGSFGYFAYVFLGEGDVRQAPVVDWLTHSRFLWILFGIGCVVGPLGMYGIARVVLNAPRRAPYNLAETRDVETSAEAIVFACCDCQTMLEFGREAMGTKVRCPVCRVWQIVQRSDSKS